MSQNKLFPLSNTITFVNTIYAQLRNWFSEKAHVKSESKQNHEHQSMKQFMQNSEWLSSDGKKQNQKWKPKNHTSLESGQETLK